MSVPALLLSDSRFPAGGHAHSGGVEPAVTAGTVSDLASLEAFLRGRLRTAGLVAAGLAAAACARAGCAGYAGRGGRGGRGGRAGADLADLADLADVADLADAAVRRRPLLSGARGKSNAGRMEGDQRSVRYDGVDLWDLLDAEADARTPSPAQRAASRRQGRALLRAARVAWPDDGGLAGLAASGAATAGTGRAAPLWLVAVPARGQGPRVVALLLARRCRRSTGAVRTTRSCSGRPRRRPGAGRGTRRGSRPTSRWPGRPARPCGCLPLIRCSPPPCWPGSPATSIRSPSAPPRLRTARSTELPCPSAPALDLLAEAHVRAEVRLFES